MVLKYKDVKGILMVFISVSLWMVKDMAKVNSIGIMVKLSKANGN